MTNLSFNIYKFTLGFLKENRKKFTTQEKWGIFFTIAFLLSYMYFIFSIGYYRVDDIKIKVSGIVMFASLITFALIFSNLPKDNKLILEEYKAKYINYYKVFIETYAGFLKDTTFEQFIKHTVSELENEINDIKSIKKNRMDKMVTLLTPVPFITMYFSITRNLGKLIDYSPYIVVILIVNVVVIYEVYKQIEYPSFNFSNKQKDKQYVCKYLREILKYKELGLEQDSKNEEVSSPENIEERKERMKYKLVYVNKVKDNFEICNILWGVYMHEKEVDKKRFRIFWGLIEWKVE